MDTSVIILDAYRQHRITGQFVKRWPDGVTIDDARGIRHFATFDRVVTPLPDAIAINPIGTQADLWRM